jgi:hypothetical protein
MVRPVTFFEAFNRFRKTLVFRLLYMVLLGVILGLVIPIARGIPSLVCFLAMGIGVALFAMPYLIGERSARRIVAFAMVAVAVAPFVAAPLQTSTFQSIPEEIAGGDLNGFTLRDGRVAPYVQDGSGPFTFSVNVSTPDPALTPDSLLVYVFVLDADAAGSSWDWLPLLTVSGTNLSRGVTYSGAYEARGGALHYHRFEVFAANVTSPAEQCPPFPPGAQTWEEGRVGCFFAGAPNARPGEVPYAYGPINAGGAGLFAIFLVSTFLYLLVPVLTLVILILMYWWTRRAREIRRNQGRDVQQAIAAAGGEFTCSNCGKDVPGSATTCPHCGAEFDEPEKPAEPAKPVAADAPKPEETKAKSAGEKG